MERLLTGPGQRGSGADGSSWAEAGGGAVGECTLRVEFKRASARARAAAAKGGGVAAGGTGATGGGSDDDESDEEEALDAAPSAAAAGGGRVGTRRTLQLTAKGREPTFQTVFEVEAAAAAQHLPASGLSEPGQPERSGWLCARATLFAQDGRELARTAEGGGWSAALQLPAAGKAKGWLQVGHEPTHLRVQLLLVRAPAGSDSAAKGGGSSGFTLGSVRVTAPERHALRLEFVPETSGDEHTAVVLAEGCALAGASQALFRPTGGTGSVPLPASCRVRGELRAGERVWRAAETRLELSTERALQWAQVGKGSAALRLQLRLRQAVHAGVRGARAVSPMRCASSFRPALGYTRCGRLAPHPGLRAPDPLLNRD